MTHAVLASFDRLVESLALFADTEMPPAALLLPREGAPALLGMGDDRNRMVAVHHVIPGGHKRLAYEAARASLHADAVAFQNALRAVPGLAAIMDNSALAFAFSVEGNALLFSWWPTHTQDTVHQLFDSFHEGDVSAEVLRSVLAQAVENAPKAAVGMVDCVVFNGPMLGTDFVVHTFPQVLAAFTPFLHQDGKTRIGLFETKVVLASAPPVAHEGLDPTHKEEIARVRAAYGRLVEAFQQAPNHTYGAFYDDLPCRFSGDPSPNSWDAEWIERPMAQKQPLAAPPYTAPQDGSGTWMDHATEAWHAFVAAFPAGRHWAYTTASTELDYHGDKPDHILPIVRLHPCESAYVFDVERAGLWLRPQGPRGFFVQTHGEGGVFQVDAESAVAAAGIGYRMCPPPEGPSATILVWDAWRG